MNPRILVLVFPILLLAGAGACARKTVNKEPSIQAKPCSKDVETFCDPSTKPIEKMRCLVEHKNEISTACYELGLQVRKNKMVKVCADEIALFCPDLVNKIDRVKKRERVRRNVFDCFRPHMDDPRVSKKCKDQLDFTLSADLPF